MMATDWIRQPTPSPRAFFGLGAAALVAWLGFVGACSDDDAAGGAGGTATGSATGGQGTGGDGGGAAGGGGLGGGTTSPTGGGGAGGGSGGGPSGLSELGTLVVLGDSIGDGGGVGPYYYELLRQSLEARYGAIDYRNNADSGSETDALVGQIGDLPGTIDGPVAVTISSGGNDMKAHIVEIVAGLDGPFRLAMGTNIDAALDLLLQPNRFGPGVEVFVFEANIYDASDGQGNFGDFNCNFSFPVALPTDGYFASWNGEIASRVDGHGQALVDMHGWFYGHGFNNPPNWYHSDCTHPNAVGHDQLHRLFYQHITGETLP